ncbi:biotin--[acetyl-CoA-carboxylase] ligase [Glaciihabitans arcticus]|uniref:biotin--[biotin carboxyl-carrier protein] ligase n=1 Tax=Glaciihabitans arcticus TaxID=2668039 RepID=A0A4Q9GMN4_9MICO|nr:biotin--[acetyl-CoA-carboxylase] ligase [Glaciihabitans arcticus]TBN55931.1 biotin--[acetyl-CoA-carboxylase] ligase [Glaciihabitans arcticus]
MELPRSLASATALEILPVAGSTNDELVGRAADLPEFSVVVTDNQTAGRGRLGREWIAPPGAALAVSVLLRPVLPHGEPLALEHYGWLPLISGLAMARAVASLLPQGEERVGLKWPNDVQVNGAKVCGILAELLPTADAVVIGAGLNVSMTREQLPIPTATSLALSGATLSGDELVDAALSRYLDELRSLYTGFVRLGADAEGSGLLELLTERCTTLGKEVLVHLPGGDELRGTATSIDRAGRLVVRGSRDGHSSAVAAGDVTHVRYE